MDTILEKTEDEKEEYTDELAKQEKALFEKDDFSIPPSDVVAFNELRSCADLVFALKGYWTNIVKY
ncbi:MAG: hypothetical protein HN390_13840 [Anaerolineae bacterium]|jgi:hypothetical protein|nr:hypothetical protein [Anaerolineae bacterium]MBT7191426.1 hypothetical protein [Anaerolineae bacterium]MBT7992014.1 hypothetical protein [Anaerolineae bacterium]